MVDVSGLQSTIFDPSIVNLFFSDNAADADITGLEGDFLHRWGTAWLFAFPLAFLAGNFFSPISRKITDRLTKS